MGFNNPMQPATPPSEPKIIELTAKRKVESALGSDVRFTIYDASTRVQLAARRPWR